MKDNGIPLAGAVHDFTCPKTGKGYMHFPIRKYKEGVLLYDAGDQRVV